MTSPIERKLTTIMAADVADYSRMMEEDEVGTLQTLRAYRTAMEGIIQMHRGRVVSTAGDSVLAEFPSVVEAVQAAAEIQRELAARNEAARTGRPMRFRIGINLGDVMVDGDDIFGEGVNIAARLEGMAEPGGILISGTVYDQVKNKLTLGYDFLGQRSVKNITEKVPTYRVEIEPGAAAVQPPSVRPEPLGAAAPPVPAAAADVPDATDEELSVTVDLSGARSLVLIGILVLIDWASGPGWWVQWPAIGILGVGALQAVRGSSQKLAVIAVILFLVDWASGPGWWAHWPAIGILGIIALQQVARTERSSG